MIVLILCVGALGMFFASLAAGRYASWFGVAVPVAITIVLGQGWGWDPEASLLIIASALVGGLGFAVGLSRRRRVALVG